jgi:hypothetical protein
MPIILRSAIATWIAGASLCAAEPCFASTIIDPSDDILSTYIGQVGPDLDILQFTVTPDATNFYLQVLLSGAPGTTALAKYNIGINRGAGINTFPPGFWPGASLDAVVNLVPSPLAAEVRLFVGGVVVTITPLPSGAFTISGNTMAVTVPISMLPSTGFDTDHYIFLLWSRTQPAAGVPQQLGIADFAPDQGSLSLLPEPSTWEMMLVGFGAMGFLLRRRRSNSRLMCRHSPGGTRTEGAESLRPIADICPQLGYVFYKLV